MASCSTIPIKDRTSFSIVCLVSPFLKIPLRLPGREITKTGTCTARLHDTGGADKKARLQRQKFQITLFNDLILLTTKIEKKQQRVEALITLRDVTNFILTTDEGTITVNFLKYNPDGARFDFPCLPSNFPVFHFLPPFFGAF